MRRGEAVRRSGITERLDVRLLFTLLARALTAQVFAEGTGPNVGGYVIDDTRLPLPDMTVTITSKALERSQVVVTANEGNSRAVALQPAEFEISAEMEA